MKLKSLLVFFAALAAPAGAQEPGDESDIYSPHQLGGRELPTACALSSLTATGRLRQRYGRGFVSGAEEVVRLQRLSDSTRAQNYSAYLRARQHVLSPTYSSATNWVLV